jgi:hypothetical protein
MVDRAVLPPPPLSRFCCHHLHCNVQGGYSREPHLQAPHCRLPRSAGRQAEVAAAAGALARPCSLPPLLLGCRCWEGAQEVQWSLHSDVCLITARFSAATPPCLPACPAGARECHHASIPRPAPAPLPGGLRRMHRIWPCERALCRTCLTMPALRYQLQGAVLPPPPATACLPACLPAAGCLASVLPPASCPPCPPSPPPNIAAPAAPCRIATPSTSSTAASGWQASPGGACCRATLLLMQQRELAGHA